MIKVPIVPQQSLLDKLMDEISPFHVNKPKAGELLTYVFDREIYEKDKLPVYLVLDVYKASSGTTHVQLLCVGGKINYEIYGAQVMCDGEFLNNYIRFGDNVK